MPDIREQKKMDPLLNVFTYSKGLDVPFSSASSLLVKGAYNSACTSVNFIPIKRPSAAFVDTLTS